MWKKVKVSLFKKKKLSDMIFFGQSSVWLIKFFKGFDSSALGRSNEASWIWIGTSLVAKVDLDFYLLRAPCIKMFCLILSQESVN